ncbi:hypothetical protein B0H17DRAFT_1149770 [Mycena rosella]|uniref:Uncharacterized protein n=1 Tax=Mycena rosella TaxID=1033263 RepID=A0AAD7BY53_MYCRO|nr:hypothetical protein B0H17DRAFT_1149770 [Mycena rosella]
METIRLVHRRRGRKKTSQEWGGREKYTGCKRAVTSTDTEVSPFGVLPDNKDKKSQKWSAFDYVIDIRSPDDNLKRLGGTGNSPHYPALAQTRVDRWEMMVVSDQEALNQEDIRCLCFTQAREYFLYMHVPVMGSQAAPSTVQLLPSRTRPPTPCGKSQNVYSTGGENHRERTSVARKTVNSGGGERSRLDSKMGDWELIRAVLASRDTDEQYQRVNTDCSSRFLLTSYHDIAQPRFVLWLRGRPLLTGNHDIVQPRFLMASNHIAQLSMQLLPDGIIDKPPSPSDKPGFFYEFLILEDDEDEDEDTDVVKLGRAVHPLKRRRQWARQCRGQRQRWQFCWKVPFTAKFARGLVTVSGEETKSRRMSELRRRRSHFPRAPPPRREDQVLERVLPARARRLQQDLAAGGWTRCAYACDARRDARDSAERCACAARIGGGKSIGLQFSDHRLEPRKITPVQIFLPWTQSSLETRLEPGQDACAARRDPRDCATRCACAARSGSPDSFADYRQSTTGGLITHWHYTLVTYFSALLDTFWVDKGGRKRGAPRTKVWRMPTSGWDGPLCRATYGCGCSPTNTTSGHTSPPTKTMCRRVSEPTKAMCGRVREPTKATSGRGCSPTKEGRGRVFGETKGDEVGPPQGQRRGCVPSKVTYGRDDRLTMATSGRSSSDVRHTSPPTKTTPEHSCSPTKAMCGRVCIWGDKGGTKSGRLKGKGVVTSRARRRTGGMIAQQWRRPGVVLATSGRSSSDVRAYFSADKDDVQA